MTQYPATGEWTIYSVQKSLMHMIPALRVLPLAAVFVLAMQSTDLAADEALTKTDGLYMAFSYSFMQDECGHSVLGERFREALLAKLESCPFTDEAKLGFYKKMTLSISHDLSTIYDSILTVPSSRFTFPKHKYCEQLDDWDAKILERKLAEYDSGKIKLPDVVVNSAGAPTDCMALEKGEGSITQGPESASGVNVPADAENHQQRR